MGGRKGLRFLLGNMYFYQGMRILFIFLFIFYQQSLTAQKMRYGASISAIKYIQNNPIYPAINIPAFAFALQYKNTKQSKFPFHIEAQYIYHNNPRELGSSLSLAVSQDFFIGKKISIEPIVGLAYHTKKYDEWSNPRHYAFGTHLTNYSALQLNYHIHQKTFYAGVIHFSNGNVRVPDAGLNGIYLGIQYNWKEMPKLTAQNSIDVLKRESYFEIATSLGIKSTTVNQGPQYPVYTAQLSYGRGVAQRHHWLVYSLFLQDISQKDKNDIDERYDQEKFSNSIIWNIGLGYELALNHWFIQAQGGINVFQKSIPRTWIMTGLDIGYYVYDRPSSKMQVALYTGVKANFGVADFVELGIAFRRKR